MYFAASLVSIGFVVGGKDRLLAADDCGQRGARVRYLL